MMEENAGWDESQGGIQTTKSVYLALMQSFADDTPMCRVDLIAP